MGKKTQEKWVIRLLSSQLTRFVWVRRLSTRKKTCHYTDKLQTHWSESLDSDFFLCVWASMHDNTWNIGTETVCTQWSALYIKNYKPHWTKVTVPLFFPSTLLNKTDVLIMKITINSKEWPLKMCVRKSRMHYILNKQFWLNISRVISKVSEDGNFLFWLSVAH